MGSNLGSGRNCPRLRWDPWARHQIPDCSPGAAVSAAHCSRCVCTWMVNTESYRIIQNQQLCNKLLKELHHNISQNAKFKYYQWNFVTHHIWLNIVSSCSSLATHVNCGWLVEHMTFLAGNTHTHTHTHTHSLMPYGLPLKFHFLTYAQEVVTSSWLLGMLGKGNSKGNSSIYGLVVR